MQDRTLVSIALSFSGIGLTTLLLLIIFVPIPPYTNQPTGARVKLTGETSAVREGNITTFTLSYPANIQAVVFENVSVPDCATIIGKVSEYEERKQLTVTRLVACRSE